MGGWLVNRFSKGVEKEEEREEEENGSRSGSATETVLRLAMKGDAARGCEKQADHAAGLLPCGVTAAPSNTGGTTLPPHSTPSVSLNPPPHLPSYPFLPSSD